MPNISDHSWGSAIALFALGLFGVMFVVFLVGLCSAAAKPRPLPANLYEPEPSDEPIFDRLCADLAHREAQYLDSEWYTKTPNGEPWS